MSSPQVLAAVIPPKKRVMAVRMLIFPGSFSDANISLRRNLQEFNVCNLQLSWTHAPRKCGFIRIIQSSLWGAQRMRQVRWLSRRGRATSHYGKSYVGDRFEAAVTIILLCQQSLLFSERFVQLTARRNLQLGETVYNSWMSHFPFPD